MITPSSSAQTWFSDNCPYLAGAFPAWTLMFLIILPSFLIPSLYKDVIMIHDHSDRDLVVVANLNPRAQVILAALKVGPYSNPLLRSWVPLQSRDGAINSMFGTVLAFLITTVVITTLRRCHDRSYCIWRGSRGCCRSCR